MVRRPIFFGALLIALAAIIIGSHQSACGERYRADEVIQAPRAKVAVQVAMTQAERQRGLSGRLCLQPDRGMLFIFGQPGYYAFWMRDMHFDIDIVWLSADKSVVQVDTGVKPSTYPNTFLPSQPAKYVLELGAGQAEAKGITAGRQLTF
jgi:uncharacterized membrane protein (UPF0127 family)